MAPATGAALLALAREAVEAFARGQGPVRRTVPGGERKAGVFVTLHCDGALRGCMGHLDDDLPLQEIVAQMALAAARDDPRFPPLAADELDVLDVRLSVLSAPQRARPEDVVPGRDGVIVRQGRRQGVFLPSVAKDEGWSRERLLAMACRKAGLPAEAWRDSAAALYVFQAQVFPADVV